MKLVNHFENDYYIYLVLEYCENGQLVNKLKKEGGLSEILVANCLREVISAVQYLHAMDEPIIHRDIKPENILLDSENNLKLADFGWSNYFRANKVRTTLCGTPEYE